MAVERMYEVSAWFVLAFFMSSFTEYWLHRMLHVSPKHPLRRIFPKIGEVHRNHHVRNAAQGVIGEFRDYIKGGIVYLFLLFFYSKTAGMAWLLGSVFYALFAAYSHQLQHENPRACFWMKMPVHYVHHKYNQWHHNFGLGFDWWDRLFGTYKPVEWIEEQELSQTGGFWEVKWR